MLTKRAVMQLVVMIGFLLAGCTAIQPGVGSQRGAGEKEGLITADVVTTAPATGGREDMMDPIVLKDALTNIEALEKTFDWKPFRPGVEIARIYNTPDGGPSAAFLKYEAGASVPLHMHGGYEHIFILKGTQVDRSGEHGAGTVMINPPGSSHMVSSPQGCIVLIVWDKPVILAK